MHVPCILPSKVVFLSLVDFIKMFLKCYKCCLWQHQNVKGSPKMKFDFSSLHMIWFVILCIKSSWISAIELEYEQDPHKFLGIWNLSYFTQPVALADCIFLLWVDVFFTSKISLSLDPIPTNSCWDMIFLFVSGGLFSRGIPVINVSEALLSCLGVWTRGLMTMLFGPWPEKRDYVKSPNWHWDFIL